MSGPCRLNIHTFTKISNRDAVKASPSSRSSTKASYVIDGLSFSALIRFTAPWLQRVVSENALGSMVQYSHHVFDFVAEYFIVMF